MKIGELARATGTALETIRFYEREGLLPAAQRTAGNFRIYGPEHVERLAFARYCRGLDMGLDDIRLLMRFKDAPHEECGEVNALLDEQIANLARRIQELQQLERELKALRGRCGNSREARDCGILEGLSKTARQAAGRPSGARQDRSRPLAAAAAREPAPRDQPAGRSS